MQGMHPLKWAGCTGFSEKEVEQLCAMSESDIHLYHYICCGLNLLLF